MTLLEAVILLIVLAITSILVYSFILLRKLYNLEESYKSLEFKYNKTYKTLSSIRVRHGQAWEKWIPMSKKFQEEVGPREKAVFMGQPIDFVHFGDEYISFIEVKTGEAKLNTKQRKIRDMVKDKKIRWIEMNDEIN